MKSTILLGLILCSCGLAVSKEFDHKFVLLNRGGKPLSNVLIIGTIQGKNSHWWDDGVITGEWEKSRREIEQVKCLVLKTDSRGEFSVRGKGVHLGLVAFADFKVYSVLSKKLSLFSRLPKVLQITDDRYSCPVQAYPFEQDGLDSHPLVTDLLENLAITATKLMVHVTTDDDQPASGIPYEVFFSDNGESFLRYTTNVSGFIYIDVPKERKLDLVFYPNETDWPGLHFFVGKRQFKKLRLKGISPLGPPKEIDLTITLEKMPRTRTMKYLP